MSRPALLLRQSFKRNYLQHALALSDWLRRHPLASASICATSQRLSITLGERTVRFEPQFVRELGGGEQGGVDFVGTLAGNVSGFVGWLPEGHGHVNWPLAHDKQAFKGFAARHGLPVPAWGTTAAADAQGAVLVKSFRSTLGRGQRGPFLLQPGQPAPSLAPGEYLERFVCPGQLLKAWFWGERLVVAELSPMPSLQGDGKRSLQELIAAALACAPDNSPLPEPIVNLLALQGLAPERVLPVGVSAWVDYRYLSPLNPAMAEDCDRREVLRGSAIEATLLRAAALALAELQPRRPPPAGGAAGESNTAAAAPPPPRLHAGWRGGWPWPALVAGSQLQPATPSGVL